MLLTPEGRAFYAVMQGTYIHFENALWGHNKIIAFLAFNKNITLDGQNIKPGIQ